MMSFWKSARRGETRLDDSSTGGNGYESGGEDESIQNDPSADIVLFPKQPPPTINVFQHTSMGSGPEKNPPLRINENDNNGTIVNLSHLTRRRPLDPVFGAEAKEGTFPKLVGNPQMSKHPPVQIFDPSQKSPSQVMESGEEPVDNNTNLQEVGDQAIPSQEGISTQQERSVFEHEQTADRDEATPADEGLDEQVSAGNDDDSTDDQEYDASTDGTESQQREMGLDDAVYDWGGSDNETETTEELLEELATQDGSEQSEPSVGEGWVDTAASLSANGSDSTSENDEGWNKGDIIQEDMVDEEGKEVYVELENPVPSKNSETSVQYQENNTETDHTSNEPMLHAAVEEEEEQIKNDSKSHVEAELDATKRTSKFVFLSDQKDVPSGLKLLQERTMRRRRDLLARMHDLECQLAKISSNYAEEKMDLDLAVRDTFDRSVAQPLEAATERLIMEREASSTRGPGVGALEQRLMKLDHQMTHQIYVIFGDRKRKELESIHADLFHDIIPQINIENSKSNKIENGVIRRLEDVTGSVTKQFHDECAASRASVHQVKQKVNFMTKTEDQRLDHILLAISELRAKARKERAERREMDARILESIVGATVTMKRALLQAVGDMN